jgi:4-cresol dehydrogenase (hydroxylating)
MPQTDPESSSKSTRVHLADAIEAWRRDLGSDHVLTDDAVLAQYSHSTLSSPIRALAVIRPSCQEEVIGAVKTAGRHQIPLYPISRGKNWGYGDACPVTAGNVILDLSRMNRILEVNVDLATAIVEPGVTQGQLSTYLLKEGIPLWPDCTGAGPDTSIIGNVLDRGFGHTPYGNRANHISGLEVVLADGRLLKTGFGHFEGSRVTQLFPYGIGPSLDGLFVQSGLGIVTRMGIWLMPKPEAYSFFVCSLQDDEAIAGFVEDLRPLRLDGTVKSVVHMGNDLRMLSGGMSYPWHLSPDGRPLSVALRRELRAAGGLGAWTIAGGLYGSKNQVAAARREVSRRLSGAGRRLQFFDERKLDLADRVLSPFTRFPKAAALRRKLAALRAVYDMNRGRPSPRFLAGAYWRHRGGLPKDFDRADPARDGCGLIWLPPVLPFTGDAVRQALSLAEPIFAQHGFDFFATLSTVTERALSAVMTIAYDKSSQAETDAARACYRDLLQAMVRGGYPPYRLNPAAMAANMLAEDPYWQTVDDLKRVLDPHRIVAPGRYSRFEGPGTQVPQTD